MPHLPDDVLGAIRAARALLPAGHRQLLNAIGVQEGLVQRWTDDVIAMYATLREPTPTVSSLNGAAAAWLHELRTVVFNAQLFDQVLHGLDAPSRDSFIRSVAWHEYGHALSVVRAGREQRQQGLQLLALLPEPMREAIDYPGRYRTSQVFDEIMATLYALLVDRVRISGYSPPDFLHPDVFAAFKEVYPWPPSP